MGLLHIIRLTTLLATVASTLAAADLQLKAGVSRADITPPFGEYILTASSKIAKSARDPLFARVVVLESGEKRAAIVSLDLVGPFPPEIFDPYRERRSWLRPATPNERL